ncbi:MAG TPA: hypothetical protein PKA28_14485 [Methylomusa anaerophila]|nr:hypothetical protein [Methylomusa anaerophila]
MDNSYLCFSSDSTKTLNFIDDYFKNWILAQGGQEYHVPALINRNVLEKCGYFSSFPQHLTVAGFVKPEFYPNVATDSEVKDEYIAMKEQYLTPAACLHIYPMLEGDNIKENTAITTLARVYRYEHGNFDGITRLWDFTVREIVFVGASDYVLRQLEKTKQLALEFTQKLGLSADIIEANDQFYPSQKNIIKAKLQKANSLKHELSLQIKEKQVAIASFNFHDTHFSKAFNFDDGGKIVTGCVGFGLERWLAVINENNIHLDKVTY